MGPSGASEAEPRRANGATVRAEGGRGEVGRAGFQLYAVS